MKLRTHHVAAQEILQFSYDNVYNDLSMWRGCSDIMRAENGKLHSLLELPKYVFSIFHIQGSHVGAWAGGGMID